MFGAVKRVDEKLDGQFARMVEMKLFMGVAMTGVYLRPPTVNGTQAAYPGAVVVGLGTIGELTPGTLTARPIRLEDSLAGNARRRAARATSHATPTPCGND